MQPFGVSKEISKRINSKTPEDRPISYVGEGPISEAVCRGHVPHTKRVMCQFAERNCLHTTLWTSHSKPHLSEMHFHG